MMIWSKKNSSNNTTTKMVAMMFGWQNKKNSSNDLPAPSENVPFCLTSTIWGRCFFSEFLRRRCNICSFVPHCPSMSPVVTFGVLPHFFFKKDIVKQYLQVLISPKSVWPAHSRTVVQDFLCPKAKEVCFIFCKSLFLLSTLAASYYT